MYQIPENNLSASVQPESRMPSAGFPFHPFFG
jgi:hypothetical protein